MNHFFNPGTVHYHKIYKGSLIISNAAESSNNNSIIKSFLIDSSAILSDLEKGHKSERKASIEMLNTVKKRKSNNRPPIKEHPLKQSEISFSGKNTEAVIEGRDQNVGIVHEVYSKPRKDGLSIPHGELQGRALLKP